MVYMADQPITTSIDDLVKYLNEHGESDSSTLAAALKVNENIIETWADVLEKAQIVKVNYKLGKMYVSPMITSKEGIAVAKKTVELKRDVAEAELVTQINMINQVSAKLEEFKRYVVGAEGAFRTKAGEVKQMLDQIDRLNAQVDGAYKKLKEKSDYINDISAKLDKEAQKLEEKAKAAQVVTGGDSESKRVVSDIMAKLDDAEGRLKALNSDFIATAEQNRRAFAQLVNSIREEEKLLKETLNQREREVQDYSSSLSSYKQESDSIKRQVTRERARMIDEVAKSTEEARKVYAVAEKQIIEAKKVLLELKGQFGGFAVLSGNLNGIKSSIDAISTQKDEIQKELNELSEQLKAISAAGEGEQTAQKSIIVQQTEEKLSGTEKRIEALGKKTDEVKKGIDDIAK
jgi:chromosome segregation ATPase